MGPGLNCETQLYSLSVCFDLLLPWSLPSKTDDNLLPRVAAICFGFTDGRNQNIRSRLPWNWGRYFEESYSWARRRYLLKITIFPEPKDLHQPFGQDDYFLGRVVLKKGQLGEKIQKQEFKILPDAAGTLWKDGIHQYEYSLFYLGLFSLRYSSKSLILTLFFLQNRAFFSNTNLSTLT